jgi:outer membrane protein OmpA-like peptidoglycan-associated protein
MHMSNHRFFPLSIITIATLAACSLTPNKNLDEARSDYAAAQANTQVTQLAPSELSQAADALNKANEAWSKGEDAARVDQLAYVAKQRVAIADETARQKRAETASAAASANRDRIRLDSRTAEADAAQRSATASQLQSEASQRTAEESRLKSEASQRSAAASQLQSEASQRTAEESRLQSEASQRSAAASQLQSEASQRQAQDAEARSGRLEAQLKELDAKKTARGLVVTLGDVLFDTGKAQLKSGGIRGVQKLADVLKEYPQRNVLVEGFTDSTGGSSSNQDLSDRRAKAVRTALLETGIGAERITNRGYGQTFPVASNATATGRQLNRRVEIVVSEDGQKIAPR